MLGYGYMEFSVTTNRSYPNYGALFGAICLPCSLDVEGFFFGG